MSDNEANELAVNVHAHPTADRAALEKRLEEARERKRIAEAKRLAMETEGELQRRVEIEEIAAADEEAIAKYEEEIGAQKIRVVHTDVGCVIVKRPNPLLYKKFRDQGNTKTKDLEKLVHPCLVYPTVTQFEKMMEEQAATLDRTADAVVTLAGFRRKEVSEK